MFKLDPAISEWRRQMLATGIKAPVPLEELESHLRDEIEQQMRLGLGEKQAFQLGVRQLGGGRFLKQEFQKNQPANFRKSMLQTLIILSSLFGTIMGGAMILPALGRWHQTGSLMLWPLIAGLMLVMLAGLVVWQSLRRQRGLRGRKWISAGIIAAGAFYIVPLGQALFRQPVDIMGWLFCIGLAVASLGFFGTCLRLNRRQPV